MNLPAQKKMTEPRYQGIISRQIPSVHHDNAILKVIAGNIADIQGPVTDCMVQIEYFDVTLAKGKEFIWKTKRGYTTLVYVIDGSGSTDEKTITPHSCALYNEGDSITVSAEDSLRFLFISGQPLDEQVAWGGPIVMNTETELQRAFEELEKGTFIKSNRPVSPTTRFYR